MNSGGRSAAALLVALAAAATLLQGGASAHPRWTLGGHTLLSFKDNAAGAVAVASRFLVWEEQPSDEHPLPPLVQRDERTGKMRVLATEVLPQFGLAATQRYVVYAAPGAGGTKLMAVRHDGRRRIALSRSLAAPVTSRGERVAWAEQPGDLQRVVVRNMATGVDWVAGKMPRCNRGKCYRIDAVTLADDGVVFDRGAIGPQPSLIVRRRFDDARPETVSLPDDPQPDLAQSSAGAIFLWLRHGWMRWPFGVEHPEPVGLSGLRWWVIGEEGGRTLVRTAARCRPRLILRLPGKRAADVPVPNWSPTGLGPRCGLIAASNWTGRRLVVAWAVIPTASLDAHTNDGLSGQIIETRVP